MARRPQIRRTEPSTAGRSWLAWLALCAQLWLGAHFAGTPHERDAEGHLVHCCGHGCDAHAGDDEGASPGDPPAPGAPDEDPADEECSFQSPAPAEPVDRPLPAPPSAPFVASAPLPVRRDPPAARPPLEHAPKQSPPAVQLI